MDIATRFVNHSAIARSVVSVGKYSLWTLRQNDDDLAANYEPKFQ